MSQTHNVFLADQTDTIALGRILGDVIKNDVIKGGAVVYLDGCLGAGKTTLCRGILAAFGYSGAVKSPTYTLVEPYELDTATVYHFDLYRLGEPEELEYMGIRDYFNDSAICIVEWFERGEGILPKPDICVSLAPEKAGRHATVDAITSKGQAIINAIISSSL